MLSRFIISYLLNYEVIIPFTIVSSVKITIYSELLYSDISLLIQLLSSDQSLNNQQGAVTGRVVAVMVIAQYTSLMLYVASHNPYI
jgi:hypothetical protein